MEYGVLRTIRHPEQNQLLWKVWSALCYLKDRWDRCYRQTLSGPLASVMSSEICLQFWLHTQGHVGSDTSIRANQFASSTAPRYEISVMRHLWWRPISIDAASSYPQPFIDMNNQRHLLVYILLDKKGSSGLGFQSCCLRLANIGIPIDVHSIVGYVWQSSTDQE